MRLPKLDKAATATILATSALVIAAAFLLTTRWSGSAAPDEPIAEKPVIDENPDRPKVDVVFALDTTGSMSGLINSAKQKIWSIANNLAAGQPRPDIRFGLVFYRDKSDEYVTRTVALSDDIDHVYDRLMEVTTGGGGDTPEHVNAALEAAINDMQWRRGDKVLRLVFLVGDAPPHDDYADSKTSMELAKLAAANDIVINTIRAGWDRQTELAWQAIAGAAQGAYASIKQDGGTIAVTTPYDDELARYNGALADSSVGWGSAERRARGYKKVMRRKAMKGEVAASAASVSGLRGGALGDDDLVTAYDKGKVDIGDLEGEAAPAPIRGKSPGEKKAWLAEQKTKRAEISAKITELSKKRNAYIKSKARGSKDSFDRNVNDMLADQAEGIGLDLK
jgi:Mg-chelatase subunit ChlD